MDARFGGDLVVLLRCWCALHNLVVCERMGSKEKDATPDRINTIT